MEPTEFTLTDEEQAAVRWAHAFRFRPCSLPDTVGFVTSPPIILCDLIHRMEVALHQEIRRVEMTTELMVAMIKDSK